MGSRRSASSSKGAISGRNTVNNASMPSSPLCGREVRQQAIDFVFERPRVMLPDLINNFSIVFLAWKHSQYYRARRRIVPAKGQAFIRNYNSYIPGIYRFSM
jgi:hypothetical protein